MVTSLTAMPLQSEMLCRLYVISETVPYCTLLYIQRKVYDQQATSDESEGWLG